MPVGTKKRQPVPTRRGSLQNGTPGRRFAPAPLQQVVKPAVIPQVEEKKQVQQQQHQQQHQQQPVNPQHMLPFLQPPLTEITNVELQGDIRGKLFKRRSFVDIDDEAKANPNRTWYFKKKTDIDTLVKKCNRMLKHEPREKDALLIRASCEGKKENLQNAIGDLSCILKTEPEHATALYGRGQLQQRLGNLDAAIVDYTSLLERNPTHVNAGYSRGTCHNLKGNFAAAILDYQMALHIDEQQQTQKQRDRPLCTPEDISEYVKERDMIATKKAMANLKVELESSGTNDPTLLKELAENCRKTAAEALGIELRSEQVVSPSLSEVQGGDRSWTPPSGENPVLNSTVISGAITQGVNQHSRSFHSPDPTPTKNSDPSLISAQLNTSLQSAPDSETPLQHLDPNTPLGCSVASGSFVEAGTPLTSGGSFTQVFPSSPAARGRKPPLPISRQPSSSSSLQKDAGASIKSDSPPETGSAEYYHQLGFSYRKRGNLQGAIREYTNALQADPGHFKALFNRGFCFDKLGLCEFQFFHYFNSSQKKNKP